MELKSCINLVNTYKKQYVIEKLNFFGNIENIIFDFNSCNSAEQMIQCLYNNSLDCAICDARIFADLESDFLDWFFISIYENCDYDVLIYKVRSNLPKSIGVLTLNQWNYCKKRFQNADIGFFKESKNLQDLFEKFDAIMLPGYFSNFDNSFYTEKINLSDLQKPFFEGAACLIFKKGDERFQRLRQFFIKSVYFIGAGVGSLKYATQEAIHTIKNIEVCLFDNLMDHSLLNFLPEHATLIDVGKRCEHHKLNQSKITDLIAMYARMGYRVGRLKGGDPSIFGRLAEEINVLEDLKINFHIVPGISTINALSIKSGIILTRREVNRGFCVLSAIKHKRAIAEFSKKEFEHLPLIFFMGVKVIGKISSSLISEGYLPQTKAAVVFSIGTDKEFTVRGTLSDIANKVNNLMEELLFDNPPGIFIIGEISDFYYKKAGLLQDKKVLLPTPLDDKLYFDFKDVGANPIIYDLNVKYDISKEILEQIIDYQAVAIAHIKIAQALIDAFFEQKRDIRLLPKIITQSDNVSNLFMRYGLQCIKDIEIVSNLNLCFLYSHDYHDDFIKILSQKNKVFKVKVIHHIYNQDKLPAFDMIYFSDLDQYYDFVDMYGINCLRDKIILSKDTPVLTEISSKIQSPILIFDKTSFKSSTANLLKN